MASSRSGTRSTATSRPAGSRRGQVARTGSRSPTTTGACRTCSTRCRWRPPSRPTSRSARACASSASATRSGRPSRWPRSTTSRAAVCSFGIGFGWNREEQENHGYPWANRRAMVREKVLAMRELWTKDEASFDGEFVQFAPAWALPKPVQQPLPVHIGGGWGPKLFDAICEYGAGWMPISARPSLGSRISLLHEACERNGRDPASVEISVFGATTDPRGLESLAAGGRHPRRADPPLRSRRRRDAGARRMGTARRGRGGRRLVGPPRRFRHRTCPERAPSVPGTVRAGEPKVPDCPAGVATWKHGRRRRQHAPRQGTVA